MALDGLVDRERIAFKIQIPSQDYLVRLNLEIIKENCCTTLFMMTYVILNPIT